MHPKKNGKKLYNCYNRMDKKLMLNIENIEEVYDNVVKTIE